MLFREQEIIRNQIKEDSPFLDLASFPLQGKPATANIRVKSEGVVLSGTALFKTVLQEFGVKADFTAADGQLLTAQTVIGTLSGDAYQVLLCERTLLNTLAFMSAIATRTHNLQKELKNSKIAATRKLIPGTGLMGKLAVLDGGGDTHRLNLSECIMLKDNHLHLYGSLENAVNAMQKAKSFTKKLELEVDTPEQALKAAKLGVDILMLDNFDPKQAIATAQELKKLQPQLCIEVSGGLNQSNYLAYDSPYIDIISMGSLTTDIDYLDFSLDMDY